MEKLFSHTEALKEMHRNLSRRGFYLDCLIFRGLLRTLELFVSVLFVLETTSLRILTVRRRRETCLTRDKECCPEKRKMCSRNREDSFDESQRSTIWSYCEEPHDFGCSTQCGVSHMRRGLPRARVPPRFGV